VASHLLNDPEHWLERAHEMRALAKQSTDTEAMRVMLKIAQDYESLAIRAQERISSEALSKLQQQKATPKSE
jgi:hypothetical protein